ncbi:uncharacterized protein LOC113391312 [Ctenocephalides felis]|uniref:uncharacterized protein LOC113391312 n=1 Tax=Ctenocephalides felis TaxID=7515 RepID=UPI000E6E4B45|nr:uncharacterized protein LOC113391312 [Ctenocephalides felis]
MQETKRRERSANFTIAEIRLLSSLTAAYRDSIENKKNDAVSNKEKEAAWLTIESMFNAAIVSPQRTAKTLKLKYDGLKKASKKQMAPLFDDGLSTDPEMYDAEEKVLAMCTSVYGVENRVGSDCSVEVATPESALPKHMQNAPINEPCESGQNQVIEEPPCVTISQENGPSKVVSNNYDKWKTKFPKNLSVGLIKTEDSNPQSSNKNDKLSAAQLELVQLQIEIAKRDHEFLRIEHELKVEHMKNEERRRQETHELLIKQIIQGNCSPTSNS